MSEGSSTPRRGAPEKGRLRLILDQPENILLALVLLGMVLVPVIEIVLRATLDKGISGSIALVQHATLVVCMLGSMIAAREGRLLAFSTPSLVKGRLRATFAVIGSAVGATVSAWLAVGSFTFVEIEREVGAILTYGIPRWTIQALIPLGFATVALRLVYLASPKWSVRIVTLVVAAVLTFGASRFEVPPEPVFFAALAILAVATVFGMPIFAVLGGAALVFFWWDDIPIASLAVSHYSLVVNPSLPAIPLFTLAGYILAEGGASDRLVRVFDLTVGRLRGGPAIVTALVCAFFTTFTGGSGVTILALGGLLFPILIKSGFSERDSLGLITSAGSLGTIFPPCLPLILYAIVAQVEMERMFLGGIIPGLILVALTAWWGISRQEKRKDVETFDRAAAVSAIWKAKWELALPVVVLVALFSGFATPVEAASLTALYALIVEALVYRDFEKPSALVKVFTDCGLLVGGVLLILGVALGFTSYLIDAEVPTLALDWVTSNIQSKILFLILLNVFLLIVGCLMDVYSAIVVVVPLIVPIGAAFGVDPVHLGIIFLANLELGYLTPPVGMNLFISSYRFEQPLGVVYRSVIPMLVVRLIGVIAITYVPFLTTALPKMFLK